MKTIIARGIFAAVSLISVPSASYACTTPQFKCTLQADALPTDKPWTEPAKIAYTANSKGKDSFAIAASGQAIFGLNSVPGLSSAPVFGLLDLTWQKNNQQDKKQNAFQTSAGLHFEFDNTPGDGPITTRRGLWALWVDPKISYNRKAQYADTKKPACLSAPSSALCRTQHVESLRGIVDVSPFLGFFENTQPYAEKVADGSFDKNREGPAVAYSFGVVGSIFLDDVINNAVNPDTGLAIKGSVSGTRMKAGLALSPKFTGYRTVLKLSAQGMQTFSRATLRRDDFKRFTHLITGSLDYEFTDLTLFDGKRSFKPAFGVTYTDGEDPLVGRKDQSTWVIGLKLAFK